MAELCSRLAGVIVGTATVLGGTHLAPAAILFYEDFSDTTLASSTTTNFATIENGIASFNDASTTTRARFVDRQTFDADVMTFSFDVVAPVTNTAGSDNELVFRAGIGTANNTLSSTEFLVEAIAFRTGAGGTTGGARPGFGNQGDDTIFVVANNKETDLVFASPIDGSDVTLTAFQYINYVRNNETGDFVLLNNAGPANFPDRNDIEPGPGTIVRLGIGNSSNGHQGTFALDNVLVKDEATFDTSIPEPSSLALLAAGALALGRRSPRRPRRT